MITRRMKMWKEDFNREGRREGGGWEGEEGQERKGRS